LPAPAPSPAAFARAVAKQAAIESKRKACQEDFNTFAEYLLVDRGGEKLPPSAYSRLLGDVLVWAKSSGKHLGHMGPPGLGKSTIMGAFFVWSLGLDPTMATVVISAESRPAENRVALCRRLVTLSRYRNVFPNVKPDLHRGDMKREDGAEGAMGWRCNAFYFANVEQGPDPAMSASAAVPKTEARRVNMLLGDDLMSRTVANSAAMKKEIIGATKDTWLMGRLSNGGWACVTHNCWIDDDLLHDLKDDTRFAHLWCGVDPSGDCERMFVWIKSAGQNHPLAVNPAKYDARPVPAPAGWDAAYSIPLPPGRKEWAADHLRSLRDNPKTSASFGQLFGLRAVQPEDLVFPGWAGRARVECTAAEALKMRSDGQGFPIATELDRAQRFVFAAGLDLSGATRDGTVLTVIARTRDRRIIPIFHRRYRDILEVIKDVQHLHDNGIHFIRFAVENNAVQSQIVGVMKADQAGRAYPWRHRVQGFQTGRQKMDPDVGLPSMDALIRGGEIVWPAGECHNPANAKAEDWRRWDREMGSLTRDEVRAKGNTPDSVMSFWFALSALTGRGMAGGAIEKGSGIQVAADPGLSGW
jgi:hypothetical protein